MSGCHSYIRTYIHTYIYKYMYNKYVLLYKYVYASLSIGRVYKHPLFIHTLATMYVCDLTAHCSNSQQCKGSSPG